MSFWDIFKKQPKESMKKYLIFGLGNIGSEYINTRHNIGFKVLDYIADNLDIEFSSQRFGAVAEYSIKGRKIILLKPNTFMNLSGKAVSYWLQKENIQIDHCLIITDDLNLPFGTIRVKGKGSDGGHNGLKSIQSILNTTAYPRFRFGISDSFNKGRQVDYVLGEWTLEEKDALKERLAKSKEVVESFVLSGLPQTMNLFNNQ